MKVEYIPVPDAKNDEKIIAMHFNCWKYGDVPYTYHGCPYIRIESTTKVMPREMFNERLRASDPQKFGWENRMASARVYGNFFDLMDAGISFLFKHLSQSGVIKGLQREEHLKIPIKALREGLINSLCHRQYDLPGDSVSLAVYDDRVEINQAAS